MIRLNFSVFSVLFLISFNSIAQDLNGNWVGKLTQGPNGYSQMYDLKLDISQNGKSINGDSYSYVTDSLYYRIGFKGQITDNNIELYEDKSRVSIQVVPEGWFLCVKNLNLSYRKEDNTEYLQGTWNGVGKDDGETCTPGNIILSRTREDVHQFLVSSGSENQIPDLPKAEFKPLFIGTKVNKLEEVEVRHHDIRIRVTDYMLVDNDTISLYLNRNIIMKHAAISRTSLVADVQLDSRTPVNELLLYAENLGKVPPNTSMIEIIDHDRIFKIKIESDKQKTAALYLRYKP